MTGLRSVVQGPLSVREIARVRGCPATAANVMRAARAPLVVDEPLVTGSGVALGGHCSLTVQPDRAFSYRGHVRATGFPSYSVSIVTTVRLPAVPSAPEQVLVFTASGRAHGTNEPGDRRYAWEQTGRLGFLPPSWWRLPVAAHDIRLDYDTDWLGAASGIINLLAQLAVLGAAAGPTGAAVVLAGSLADALDVEEVVLPGMVGLVAAGGAAYVLGPGVFLPVFISGAIATAAAVRQRPLEDEEYNRALEIFGDTLPRDRIVLTNLEGQGGREFVMPAPGGAILVNLGPEFYEDPLSSYDGRYPKPGQVLIHELTHVWQIANHSFTPGYYCRASAAAVGSVGGDDPYTYQPYDGRPWSNWGTEQQATIVDRWYAGLGPVGDPITDKAEDERVNPFFRYIRDNIRTGIT